MTKEISFNIRIPTMKHSLDNIIISTNVFAAIDFIITPFADSLITGQYRTLHQIIGLPPEMTETQMEVGAAYWGITALYHTLVRDKFLKNEEKPNIFSYNIKENQ